MRFLIITACLAAYVVYVISERCDKHTADLTTQCVLTTCNGNNSKLICEHEECTCALDTNIACQQKSDCETGLPTCNEDLHEHGLDNGPGHHHPRRAPHPDMEWHCLDSLCKCF